MSKTKTTVVLAPGFGRATVSHGFGCVHLCLANDGWAVEMSPEQAKRLAKRLVAHAEAASEERS